MEELFSEHYHALCLSAKYILTDADVAKDIVQEFFCHVWDIRAQLGVIRDFRHYASRAVRNACLSYLKQAKRNIPYDSLFGEALGTEDPGEGEYHQSRVEREKVLWAAIGRLPEQRRIIFLLANKDGLSYAQVGERLGISINTVKTQIRLAYQFLRQESIWTLLLWAGLFFNNFL